MPQRPRPTPNRQFIDDQLLARALSPGTRGRTHLPRSHRCSRACGSCGQPPLSQVTRRVKLWMTRGRRTWTSQACCGRRRTVHRPGPGILRLSTGEVGSSTCCPRTVPNPWFVEVTLPIPRVIPRLWTTMGTKGSVTDRQRRTHTRGQPLWNHGDHVTWLWLCGSGGQRDWLRIRLVSSVTWL